MVHGSEDTVAFRLWPPVAIGAPLVVGWLATLLWGDPVGLGGWRAPLGCWCCCSWVERLVAVAVPSAREL